MMRRHTTLIAATIAGGVVLAITLGGCTAESKGSSSSAAVDNAGSAASAAPAAAPAIGGAVEAEPSPAAPPNSPAAAAGAGSSERNAPADQPLLAGRDVIYTADITVRATSIDSAVAQVETLADTYGGVVYAEQVDLASKDTDNPGTASATITLKVPPENLQKTLNAIGKVGTEVNRTENSDDVTEKVVDVNARINAARASIARLTDLLAHQGTVADLLNVESQLSQRDSDLESLEQQQKSLAAQTSSATITAHLEAAPPLIKATKTKQTHTFGFVRGLRGGWHAFTKTVAAIATGIGAVLPFLIVLAVLAIALILGRRKLRGRRPQES